MNQVNGNAPSKLGSESAGPAAIECATNDAIGAIKSLKVARFGRKWLEWAPKNAYDTGNGDTGSNPDR